MKARAVLLIDLENFYISREKLAPPPYGPDRFAADLEHLLAFAREAAGAGTDAERPLIVRRAYANFNSRRPRTAGVGSGMDYFLQRIPDVLLDQGVEPVQVFQLSRGGVRTKNAADMRMAMDATALLGTASGIEQFVLVTGDADFIPVILELKRHGRDVAVIGVRGATSQHLQRFVDSFDFFEDLLAAGEVTSQIGDAAATGATGPTIAEIAGALARLLSRTRPIKFAAVKPLLTKELNRPFDPLGFGYESTGDFLRRYAGELRIEVRHGPHDWEIDRPGSGAGNGPGPRPGPAPAPAATADGDMWHTAERYARLLKTPSPVGSPVEGRAVGINKVVPWAAATRIGREVYARIGPGAAGPVDRDALRKYLLDDPAGAADPNHSQCVSAAVFLLRLFGRTADGDGRVTLADGIESGEHVAICLVNDQLDMLSQRLAHNGTTGPVPAVFAELLRAGPDDTVVELVTRLLAQLAGAGAEPIDAEPEPTDAASSDAEPADAEPTDAELTDAEPANVEPEPEPAYDDSIPIAEFVAMDGDPADAPPAAVVGDAPPPPEAVPPHSTDPA
ncbi:MAG TPA: NYN domain-containing protein [Urbifossiella sp.]|nr:NYN domain-containing protein [Urbifossiella sp.]